MTSACAGDIAWSEWHCTDPVPPEAQRQLAMRMALDGCKWDMQIGDIATLAPFAVTIGAAEWVLLSSLAEKLTRELMAAERELADRPELWKRLGLPAVLRSALGGDDPWTPAAARVVRYDFHPTSDGWRISEVNSDVPGGYNEASTFTALVKNLWSGLQVVADPLEELANALCAAAEGQRSIALLSAPGYLEDHQVVAGLAAALRRRGVVCRCLSPDQLGWDCEGRAIHVARGEERPLVFGAVYRFFQGEWFTRLPGRKWRPLFRGGLTPVCNPAASVLTESKRLPIVWPRIDTGMETWKRLLPRTVDGWQSAFGSGWNQVWKPAYTNTGDRIVSRAWSTRSAVCASRAGALFQPMHWIAQSRFQTLPLETPQGRMYPCFGVYTIDGRASGIYGRLSRNPVIDYAALDVAVLIRTQA